MGCCGVSSTYGIDVEQIPAQIQNLRAKYGSDILIMAIKDQNYPGKFSLAGAVTNELTNDITALLRKFKGNEGVLVQTDEYDQMWDVTWRNTSLTSGAAFASLQKKYFPKGRVMVELLDTIASHGWGLSATPNFGGVESRDDKGNPTSTVDWPIFVFYKEEQSRFTSNHLFVGVKDANNPGKTCVSGPMSDIQQMEQEVLEAFRAFTADVKSEKDSYDDDHDVVWRGTSITTGAQMFSMGKSYFPKGKTNVAMLEVMYRHGWRAVAAPNFGGQGDSWPCYILRKVKDTSEGTPEILFASLKDSNVPGKFCISGKAAQEATDALCGAMTTLPNNDGVKSEKDSYDEDHDAVVRNVNITSGSCFIGLSFFPRGDSMNCILSTLAQMGFQVVACPNFGGMQDSWPTFVFERRPEPVQVMYLAVKDENYPGKVCLVGGGVGANQALTDELLDVLTTLCGPGVEKGKDSWDETYEIAYKNTKLTTGHATFTASKPYWPHGYVIGMMFQVLYKHGWRAEGGPNFGDNGQQWPGIVFSKAS